MVCALVLPVTTFDSGADDADLVVRAREGDVASEAALYRRHARRVFEVVARMVGVIEAEDIVQDTFVSLFERLDQLRDPIAFRAWALRTAVRQVYRRSKRRRLLRRLGFGGEPERALLAPAGGLSPEDRAQLAELERMLGELPMPLRVCWMLRFVEGHTLDEVADAAGCSLATAKRRIADADGVIRTHIAIEEGP